MELIIQNWWPPLHARQIQLHAQSQFILLYYIIKKPQMKHSQLTSWSIINLKQIYKLCFITNWPKEGIKNENESSI